MGDINFFVCLGVVVLACLAAALSLSLIALVMAVRASRSVSRLTDRLGVRPAPAAAPSFGPLPPASVPAAVPEPARPAQARTEPAQAPSAPRPPEAPPVPPRAEAAMPAPARKPIRWEELIGLKLLAWAGVIVVLFGAAFLIKYGYDQGWFGRLPWMRVVIPTIFGLALLAGGEVFARKAYRVLARVCTGGGLTAMYGAAFAAWAPLRQPLVGDGAAWVFMAAITVVAIILSVRYSSLGNLGTLPRKPGDATHVFS